jgi:hypothetical protein
MRGRLAPLAIVLIAVSLAGASLRWFLESPANTNDQAARVHAERQAAERSLPLVYLALAGAGFALMLDDRWPSRVAGGLLTVASGMLANLASAFWLLGLLVGVPLLLAASALDRFGRPAGPA